MPKGYHHLTQEERCQICALRKSGLSQPAIARQLGRDRMTIWRQVLQDGGGRGYRHKQARGRRRRGLVGSRKDDAGAVVTG